MLDLTLAQAAAAMDARLLGGDSGGSTDRPFPEVCIDSRALTPGCAFFAIAGERHDGHAFAVEALEKGASVLVIHDSSALRPGMGATVLRVADTTLALQRLATRIRVRWAKGLVAVTGSMGKTTTRSFTAGLLAERFRVLESPGNFNNHIGVPLTLLRLEQRHDVAVVELGMNHPGEIGALGRICRPSDALLTNVAPVHLEFFDSVDRIADAKAEILESLPPEGRIFFNLDDARVRAIAGRFPGRRVSFGTDRDAEYRILSSRPIDLRETEVAIQGPRHRLTASLPFVGRHLLHNVVAAVSVAAEFGLTEDEVGRGLKRLGPLQGRGQVLRIGRLTVWDDSYNSNPKAVEELLTLVAAATGYRRKVLVLGDMLELGTRSGEFHRAVGRLIGGSVDALITVGRDSSEIGRGAVESEFPKASWSHFADADQASDFLVDFLEPGDLVAVKGSRGIGLDRTIDRLKGGDAR